MLKFNETIKTMANITAIFFLGMNSDVSSRGICGKHKTYLRLSC